MHDLVQVYRSFEATIGTDFDLLLQRFSYHDSGSDRQTDVHTVKKGYCQWICVYDYHSEHPERLGL